MCKTADAAAGRAEKPVAPAASSVPPSPAPRLTPEEAANQAFIRAENEDDDGYDPYSDRRPAPEPLFERDPWA